MEIAVEGIFATLAEYTFQPMPTKKINSVQRFEKYLKQLASDKPEQKNISSSEEEVEIDSKITIENFYAYDEEDRKQIITVDGGFVNNKEPVGFDIVLAKDLADQLKLKEVYKVFKNRAIDDKNELIGEFAITYLEPRINVLTSILPRSYGPCTAVTFDPPLYDRKAILSKEGQAATRWSYACEQYFEERF